MKRKLLVVLSTFVSGCASIDFDSKDSGLVYYEPKPYFFVSVTAQCISTASLVSIPGVKRKMDFKAGYGSSSLSADFSNGILTKVGQTSESKIPETLLSIASLKTASMLVEGRKPACKPSATLFPIKDGVPDENSPIKFEIELVMANKRDQ